jgi:hypothetical protein
VTPDLLAWPLLSNLKTALVEEIASSALDPFCFVGIMPGGAAAFDYIDDCDEICGMAWLRLASIRESLPEGSEAPSRCYSQFIVNVELGMIRCYQTFADTEGNVMPLEYQESKAESQMAEMAAMKRVLVCSDAASNTDVFMGQYLPIGPEGGAVGGAWTAQFAIY